MLPFPAAVKDKFYDEYILPFSNGFRLRLEYNYDGYMFNINVQAELGWASLHLIVLGVTSFLAYHLGLFFKSA